MLKYIDKPTFFEVLQTHIFYYYNFTFLKYSCCVVTISKLMT